MKKQMNDAWKSDFFSQMNILLDAGLDLSGTFGILLEECREDDRAMLEQVYDDVLTGCSLSDALKRTGRFAAMDCGVVGVGEISGKLPHTMSFLSEYYAGRDRHSRMIRSSLSYPLMILGFAVLVLVFMMVVVVPVFGDIYSRMGSELPAITRHMMALSAGTPVILAVLTALTIVSALLLVKYRDSEKFTVFRSRLLMKTPVVGKLVRTDAQYTFCRLMSLLTVSGVTMMESLDLAGNSMSLVPYREAFRRVKDSVKEGGTLAGAMAEFKELFDARILSIIRVGEESNRLPEMFEKTADICSTRLESCFKKIQTWLEPVMIVFVGIIVALVLVSMYLPMFKMGTTILGN